MLEASSGAPGGVPEFRYRAVVAFGRQNLRNFDSVLFPSAGPATSGATMVTGDNQTNDPIVVLDLVDLVDRDESDLGVPRTTRQPWLPWRGLLCRIWEPSASSTSSSITVCSAQARRPFSHHPRRQSSWQGLRGHEHPKALSQ